MTTVTDRERPGRSVRPVLALLRKDLRLFTAGDALIVLGAYLLVSLQFVRYDEAFFWLSVCFGAALVFVVPLVEWLCDSDVMLNSLPVRRSTIVIARYVAALGACSAAAAVWIASGRLLAPLLPPARTGPALWSTLEGVLTFLVAANGLAAIFLPLFFRVGLGRAALAFGPVCLVLLAVSSAIAPAAGSAPIAGVALAPPSAIVSRGIDVLAAAAGPLAAVVLTVAGLGAMLSASCWISARAFERRDL